MKQNRKQQRLVYFTIGVDVLSLVVSFLAAYFFRFQSFLPLPHGIPELSAYIKALIGIVPVYLILFRHYHLYGTSRHFRRIEEIFIVIKAVTFAIIILMAGTFFYREFTYSRVFLIILWVFSIFFISLGRYLLIEAEYRRKKNKKDVTRILVIGITRNTRQLLQWAKQHPHYGHVPIGILARDESLVGKHLEDAPILGTIDMWQAFINDLNPDRVVLLDPDFSKEEITDLIVTCEDKLIDFKIGADFYGLVTSNVGVEYISNVPLLGFRPLPLDDPWNRSLKRAFDIVVSLFFLVATLPLWIFIILAVKMEGGGPIFYSQERTGRDGKSFQVLKFRTMKVGAEKETGPVWAKENDSRRTKMGNFLRRWNLDELPQFWNVFYGQMSMVGPRPERPHFVSQFRESIPRYMARHKVKAGLTGWAQVNGLRGNTSIQERIKYDLYYMENWSLLLDIEIIMMTFFAFKNAY